MATALPFPPIEDGTGALVTGAAGSFVVTAWNASTLASRPAPAVVESGGGYNLEPTDADEAAGTVVLVDCGVGRYPRYNVFAAYLSNRSNEFFAWWFADGMGAPWTGAGGTFAAWDGPGSPPSQVKITDGLFVAFPTAADITADSTGRIDAPAGAYPRRYRVGTGVYPVSPAPPLPPVPLPAQTPRPGRLTSAGDIALIAGAPTITQNDLTLDPTLETAIQISLFCDARAAAGDVLPTSDTYRRGWWADQFEAGEVSVGSRLWLLERSKRTADVLAAARAYVLEALQWLLTDGVASSLAVGAEWYQDNGIAFDITITKPGDAADSRFGYVWKR